MQFEVTQSPSVSTPGTPVTEDKEQIKIIDDEDEDIIIGEANREIEEEDGYEDMQTSLLDQDYALAMKLQQEEEDELAGEYEHLDYSDDDDEDFNQTKKRKVTRK